MPAGRITSSYEPGLLLIGDDARSRKVTLLSGQNLGAGAVLGKITLGTATAAAGAGNTGGGVLTVDAATPVLAHARPGAYVVACIAAAAGGGIFRVSDPAGYVLGDVAVGATFANQIKFQIADGAPDYALGDRFTVTVAAGSGKYRLSVAAATDGSAVPDAVLAEDCDASGGDAQALVYLAGDFNLSALAFGAGHDAGSTEEALRAKDIHLITAG